MSIRGAVMGTRYYALDSDITADGQPGSSHMLRALSMSANRLLCTGEPVVTLVWDATSGASESPGQGMLRGYGVAGWVKVAGPITVPKKPGLKTMECNVTALIGGSEICDFLMTTKASPYRPDGTGRHGAIVLSGDGSTTYQHYAATGIPCVADDDFEELTFYVRGRSGTTLAAAGTSSGTIESAEGDYVSEGGAMVDNDANFSTTIAGGHEVEFQNSANVAIMPRRRVTKVIETLGGNTLIHLAPPLSWYESRRTVGARFKVYQIPTWRIACINVNTEDREA